MDAKQIGRRFKVKDEPIARVQILTQRKAWGNCSHRLHSPLELLVRKSTTGQPDPQAHPSINPEPVSQGHE